MRTKSMSVALPLAAVGLAATLSLSGCFANPIEQLIGGSVEEAIGQGVAEGLIEGMTGTDVSIGSLPNDLPSSVPLPNATAINGAKMEVDGKPVWNVTFEVNDKGLLDTMRQQLVAAGFEEVSWIDMGGIYGGTYDGHGLHVQLSGLFEEGETSGVIGYTIVQQ